MFSAHYDEAVRLSTLRDQCNHVLNHFRINVLKNAHFTASVSSGLHVLNKLVNELGTNNFKLSERNIWKG